VRPVLEAGAGHAQGRAGCDAARHGRPDARGRIDAQLVEEVGEVSEPMSLPLPPLSELESAAISLHELYQTYVHAGFTEDQAFAITLLWLQGAIPRESR
jgi:hypothetical protein